MTNIAPNAADSNLVISTEQLSRLGKFAFDDGWESAVYSVLLILPYILFTIFLGLLIATIFKRIQRQHTCCMTLCLRVLAILIPGISVFRFCWAIGNSLINLASVAWGAASAAWIITTFGHEFSVIAWHLAISVVAFVCVVLVGQSTTKEDRP